MQDLIERLQQHKYDYDQGELVLPGLMASDCKLAAEAIQSLQSSKHTQKRKRQRLSAKNREYKKHIQHLEAKLKRQNSQLTSLNKRLSEVISSDVTDEVMYVR